jgi:hypothetical protein
MWYEVIRNRQAVQVTAQQAADKAGFWDPTINAHCHLDIGEKVPGYIAKGIIAAVRNGTEFSNLDPAFKAYEVPVQPKE